MADFELAGIVRRFAAERSDDTATVCGERRATWAELDERSSRVANGLAAAGVGRGDRVAVLARNCGEFFEIAFGTAKIGAIVVGLNWRLAPPELASVLADAEPSLVFADAGGSALLPADGPPTIGLDDEFEGWREAASADDPRTSVAPDEVAMMLYSSGTTGMPKGITVTHANISWSEQMARQGFEMGPDSVHMCAGPQFHVAGAVTGLMAMFLGGRTVIMREARPEILLETIAAERVTHAFMVPAVIQALVDELAARGSDVSSLEQVSYGAAPMTETQLRRAIDALGCRFLGVYGMTEASGTTVVLRPEDHFTDGPRAGLLRSVGKPLPWVELKVTKLDESGDAAPGEVGEIRLRSGQNSPGYWRQPEVTAATMGADGWLRTGDGAYLDEEGYVFLKDRIKDMIISGGENVYPAEVENALAAHPEVVDVAVVGVPHDRWGETVVAVVVRSPGSAVDQEALRAFARERLAGYKCPTSVDFVDELPRNASGKVLKQVLRDRAAAHA